MEISAIDLLYLTLAVIGYATGATLWTYFARPAAAPTPVAEFFDDGENDEQAWSKWPRTR